MPVATEAMAGIATVVLNKLPESKNGLASGGSSENNGKPYLQGMPSS
ncbi:hypothetical protein [Nodosilinea sp. E11]|nr:hypothetical protein [Nodosilinea sp. E11]WOD37185.1 hypothetical protein RRF56_01630 [Nodosilinea sp. E11]